MGERSVTFNSFLRHSITDFSGSGYARTEDDLHIVSGRVISEQKQRFVGGFTQPREELQTQQKYHFQETVKTSPQLIQKPQESSRSEQRHLEASSHQGMTSQQTQQQQRETHFEERFTSGESVQPHAEQFQELVAPVEMIKKEVTIVKETKVVEEGKGENKKIEVKEVVQETKVETDNQKDEKQVKDEIQVENVSKVTEEIKTAEEVIQASEEKVVEM